MAFRLALLSLILFAFVSQNRFRSKFVPPGTVRLNDTLFIDQTEIANVHWREYLYSLIAEKKDTQAYQAALPDTMVWSTSTVDDPLSQYYLVHPGFNMYPVVGISYEQAIAFCKWRTYTANRVVYFREHKVTNFKDHLNDSVPIHFYYRLPTRDEWESAATPGLDSSTRIFRKYNSKEIFSFNTRERVDSLRRKCDGHTLFRSDQMVVSVKSLYVFKSGTYNMIGNVAEMIADKGIAKGGSFQQPLDSCKIELEQHYDKPENWLGFRCVAVWIK
jgi:formylglycine-generating enzyme required for sulfatase activity